MCLCVCVCACMSVCMYVCVCSVCVCVRHWRAYTEGKACRYYCFVIFITYLYITYTVHTYICTCKYTILTYIHNMHTCTRGTWGLVAKEEPGAMYNTVEMG